MPLITNPLPLTLAPTLRPPRYNNPFGSASAVVTSQEWKEVGLPEIEYHMHNKVTSWHMFYGDVKVRHGDFRNRFAESFLRQVQGVLLEHLKKTGTKIKAASS